MPSLIFTKLNRLFLLFKYSSLRFSFTSCISLLIDLINLEKGCYYNLFVGKKLREVIAIMVMFSNYFTDLFPISSNSRLDQMQKFTKHARMISELNEPIHKRYQAHLKINLAVLALSLFKLPTCQNASVKLWALKRKKKCIVHTSVKIMLLSVKFIRLLSNIFFLKLQMFVCFFFLYFGRFLSFFFFFKYVVNMNVHMLTMKTSVRLKYHHR